MKLQTFYAYEVYEHGRVHRAKAMQGYHRQINGVSVYIAKYGHAWRAYDEDTGRWMTQENTMKGAIESAEKYVAQADSFGLFTSASYKEYCRQFTEMRKEAVNED